jgi:tRNA (uracil-5-)-methyltransferase TRM9
MSRREVRETYDRIAEHFAKTRAYAWPDVEQFIEDSPSCPVALDLGCGNGRHAELLREKAETVVCADLSREVLETTRDRIETDDRTANLVQTDAATLSFQCASVDLAVYIAALHHLPTRTLRIHSLDELSRVLTPTGRALVSVWSTEHSSFDATDGFDTTVNWTLPDGEVVERFYHIYDPAEFEHDVRDSELAVEDVFVTEGNCYAVVTAGDQ